MRICHKRIDSCVVHFINHLHLLNLLIDLVLVYLLLPLLILHSLQFKWCNRLLNYKQPLCRDSSLLNDKLLLVLLEHLRTLEYDSLSL